MTSHFNDLEFCFWNIVILTELLSFFLFVCLFVLLSFCFSKITFHSKIRFPTFKHQLRHWSYNVEVLNSQTVPDYRFNGLEILIFEYEVLGNYSDVLLIRAVSEMILMFCFLHMNTDVFGINWILWLKV